MDKDFDEWNRVKKFTNDKPETFGVHEREIWWISFGLNIGVEIDGKNPNFERPGVIIRKFNREMAWVLPITLQAKSKKFHEKFLFGNKAYFVVLTQVRTVSTKRFLRKIGMMSQDDFDNIKEKMVKIIQKNENPL